MKEEWTIIRIYEPDEAACVRALERFLTLELTPKPADRLKSEKAAENISIASAAPEAKLPVKPKKKRPADPKLTRD